MLLEKTHCAGNPDSDSQVQSENAWTVGSLLKTYISNLGGHPLHYLVISFFLLTSLGPYFFSDLSSISVQFSRSVVSDSFRPHESQHSRPFCPSPSPEFIQTHVHRVGDAIQPSHPRLSPSPPGPNPSQHQSLFQWVNSYEVAKVLEFQLSHQSFQRTPKTGLSVLKYPCIHNKTAELTGETKLKIDYLQKHFWIWSSTWTRPLW